MRNVCLLAAFWLATCAMIIVGRVTGVEFDQRQPLSYGDDYSYYGEHSHSVAVPENEEVSARTHHAKLHKLKKLKLKKRLLLQCLLGHGRRRRDTSDASGRFFLPVVLQSTNVNVGSGGGGGYGGHQQQQSHHSGCMQMFGDDNNHGPLGSPPSLGSLGSPLGSLGSALGSLGSLGPAPVSEETEEGGNRNYAADWNRYARQFRRNFVRPLYRLF
eukprot:XP_008183993.1 PREDICTED: uncharacterized protein LOC100166130 [Acyrthosiphon pisum]